VVPTVNCFSPGLIPASGLFRHNRNSANTCVCVGTVKPKTVEWGGGALAYMAVAEETGRRSGEYWSDTSGCDVDRAKYGTHFKPKPIDKETVDGESRKALWKLSCQLAGVPYKELN